MRINELPNELQCLILSKLTSTDLARSAKVCKLWLEFSKKLFKKHYLQLPFVPINHGNWLKAYAEKMKISNNIRSKRFFRIDLNEAQEHIKIQWIERVKKDSILPITSFGDYFSYAELDCIKIEGVSYPILDSKESGTLAFKDSNTLYFYNGSTDSVYAPSNHSFNSKFKAIILDAANFIIPALKENGNIQLFRRQERRWIKLMEIKNTSLFKVFHDQNKLIIQVSENQILIYKIDDLIPEHTINLKQPIRFIKVAFGELNIFSGSASWSAYDISSGRQILDTSYLVKNARFLSEKKFIQIVSRKMIAYRAHKSDLFEIDLPPFAKIIKAIFAEKMIFYVYAHEELFYVEAFDVVKKERIRLPKECHGFVYPVTINIYYENGFLLCHSRLFDIAYLFNFCVGI